MAKARRVIAWLMLAGGLIGWPLAAFWLAKDEPQFVLGLSFLALLYEAFNALQIAHDDT